MKYSKPHEFGFDMCSILDTEMDVINFELRVSYHKLWKSYTASIEMLGEPGGRGWRGGCGSQRRSP